MLFRLIKRPVERPLVKPIGDDIPVPNANFFFYDGNNFTFVDGNDFIFYN